jgi:hypothetical protein
MSNFYKPYTGNYPITSNYGNRSGGFHDGVDIGCPIGTPLVAVTDGLILLARTDQFGGLYIDLKMDDDGWRARYVHLSSFNVREGQRVKAGDIIGYSGNSGRSTGPHLHFGRISPDGKTSTDPIEFITGGLELSSDQNSTNNNADNMILQQLQQAIQNGNFDEITKKNLLGTISSKGVDFDYLLAFAGSSPRQDFQNLKKDLEKFKAEDTIEDAEYERRINQLNETINKLNSQPPKETIQVVSSPEDKKTIRDLTDQLVGAREEIKNLNEKKSKIIDENGRPFGLSKKLIVIGSLIPQFTAIVQFIPAPYQEKALGLVALINGIYLGLQSLIDINKDNTTN